MMAVRMKGVLLEGEGGSEGGVYSVAYDVRRTDLALVGMSFKL